MSVDTNGGISWEMRKILELITFVNEVMLQYPRKIEEAHTLTASLKNDFDYLYIYK